MGFNSAFKGLMRLYQSLNKLPSSIYTPPRDWLVNPDGAVHSAVRTEYLNKIRMNIRVLKAVPCRAVPCRGHGGSRRTDSGGPGSIPKQHGFHCGGKSGAGSSVCPNCLDEPTSAS